MKYYLIDYENVSQKCFLNLMRQTSKSVCISLFYTDHCKTISFDMLQKILPSVCHLELVKAKCGKNALDFQLSSYLGSILHLNAQAEYIIVSNDKGYDVVCDFWVKRGYKVKRLKTETIELNTIPCSPIHEELVVESESKRKEKRIKKIAQMKELQSLESFKCFYGIKKKYKAEPIYKAIVSGKSKAEVLSIVDTIANKEKRRVIKMKMEKLMKELDQ